MDEYDANDGRVYIGSAANHKRMQDKFDNRPPWIGGKRVAKLILSGEEIMESESYTYRKDLYYINQWVNGNSDIRREFTTSRLRWWLYRIALFWKYHRWEEYNVLEQWR